MRTRTILTTVVAGGLCATSLFPASPSSAVPGERLPSDLVWLGLGDSYSSGEGLQFVDATANPPDKNCERANGTSTLNSAGSRAYAAVAYDELRGRLKNSTFRLLACTGAISNEVHAQFDEWAATENRRADLITMTMGGNNLGFADVIFGCIGLSVEGGFAAAAQGPVSPAFAMNPFIGCTTGEDTIRTNIATLVGESGVGPDGGQTLPDMYRELARDSMNQGGHIVVVGYPNLVEESGRWAMWWLEGNRCSRIRRADVAMLRSATGELNLQLASMVDRLNTESLGVTFHWLDASQVYENDRGRHGLCTRSPWINGITFGVTGADAPFRFERSFHPTQDGHNATGGALATIVSGLNWSNLERLPITSPTTTPVPELKVLPCEGVNFGPVFDITGQGRVVESVCSGEWGLVSFTEPDPSLSVLLLRHDRAGDTEIVGLWQDLQLGDNPDYSVGALVDLGVPTDVAQAMFDEIGGPSAGNA